MWTAAYPQGILKHPHGIGLPANFARNSCASAAMQFHPTEEYQTIHNTYPVAHLLRDMRREMPVTNIPKGIALLEARAAKEQRALEKMAEAALFSGDQHLAETLAEQAVDLGRVQPSLHLLHNIPPTDSVVTSSGSPSPEERGAQMLHCLALRIYAESSMAAERDDSASAISLEHLRILIGKTRALHNLTIER